MLFVLRHMPQLGHALTTLDGDVFYQKLVIVRRKRWTLHIVYRIAEGDLLVDYIDPSWVRRTRL